MFVHSSRIKKQLEYLSSIGIDTTPVFSLAEINKEDVSNPEKMFSFEQYHIVLDYALNKTGNNDYGLDFGSEPHIGGTLGMMCASCTNLKEAFIQGCNFLKIQGNFSELTFIDDNKYPKLVYKLANAWVLQHPHTAKIEIDALFAFLVTILKFNSNNTLIPYQVNLSFDRKENIKAYQQTLGVIPNFGTKQNELVFKANDLLIPMKAFNPETFNLLKTHIENQLKTIENKETITEKVKRIILSSTQYHFPDIENVATKLNISSRTLQRQLTAESTNFKSILQETKFNIAKQLLKQNILTISEISYTLGYSDLGNFSRSFKKFTGQSPQQYKDKIN